MLSHKMKSLEDAFQVLNRSLFGGALSRSIITICPTPGAYGHFTQWKSWHNTEGEKFCEINLDAETLARPIIETIATLVHEMVHQYCFENDLKDTSRNGRYHNKVFKIEAEKRGLKISYDESHGWAMTKPADVLYVMQRSGAFKTCEEELQRAKKAASEKGKAKSSTRKYVCPACAMSVRATKEVNIVCGDCDKQLIPS